MREHAERIFERVRTRCHSELVSESPANLVGQQDFEHRKTILSAFIERFRMTKTSHSSFAKAIAFTLAETLVVMGIIGVVAALTIPNLNQSTGDREKVAKVKKIYSNLEDAFGRAQAVYGPYDEWFDGLGVDDHDTKCTRFAERMLEFMKVSKNCGLDEKGCFSSSIPTCYDGEELDESYDDSGYRVILADGASLQFFISCKIRVDIDGPNKGKNQYGNDIFDFYIDSSENQLFPSFANANYQGGYDAGNYAGNYATAWIIKNGNLDYLKCPDELNWDTKTSCK